VLAKTNVQAVAAFTSTFDHRQVVEACAAKGVHVMLSYPQAQGIIQASWNWPFNRKDMEVYGRTGYVLVPDKNRLRVRRGTGGEAEAPVPALTAPNNDPLSYLAAVVRGDIRPSGRSSLEVNLIVTEILDAARESAQTGKRVSRP